MRRMLFPKLLRVSALLILIGCATTAWYSRFYQPISPWEKQEFDRADREIYPDDVRNAFTRYRESTVVWPGIVVESNFVEHSDNIEMQLVLEHHYYDWIEDFGPQRERIFLSPRGEGLFRTVWRLKKGVDIEEWKRTAGEGTLFLVYGKPEKLDADRSISVSASYIRGIDKRWYRTDKLNYGR